MKKTTTSNDQQQQRSLYTTRLLSQSLSKKKKLFSFLSDRNAHAGITTSSASPSSMTNSTYDDSMITTTMSTTAPTKSLLVRSFLDDSDSHFLRKSLSKFQNKVKQRQDILKQNILPWFRNKQHNTTKPFSASPSSTRLDQARPILLRWWGTLLNYVQHINYMERSLYFECIVEIMARSEFIPFDNTDATFDDWYSTVEDTLMADRSPLQEYKRLLMATLRYAIEKLNHKAIYSSMISFCAKILAFGFIKIPGLAPSLLQHLSVQKTITNRLVMEMGDLKNHVEYRCKLSSILPGHLQPMMVWNLSQYKQHIRTNHKQRSPVASTGNWIRRFGSDDSELFFSFYRHYHVVLKTYITAGFPSIQTYDLHQRNTIVAISPGYLYLAAYFASKIDALLHRRLHSVTTFPQQPMQQSITPTADLINVPSIDATIRNTSVDDKRPPPIPPKDIQSQHLHTPTTDLKSIPPSPRPASTPQPSHSTFLYQSSGKPAPLEMATQRYGECLVWCVMVAEPIGLFHDMMNVWIRTIVKTTSMMAVESVFCLLDFIDVVILEAGKLQCNQTNYSLAPSTMAINPSLQPMDLPFLLHTLQLIFLQSDHAITLLRALSFVYTNFEFLVPSSALLEFMCSRILLDTHIFERLLLHWNRNIRTFFLRCLLWRIGRTWSTASVKWWPITQLLTTASSTDDHLTSTDDSLTSGYPVIRNSLTLKHICDGNSCWKALKRPQDMKNNVDEQDYRQCSLQVHILLETLLDSFQQRYAELDKSSLDTENSTAPLIQPDKIRFYTPNLPSTSLDILLDQLPLQSYTLPTSSSSNHSHVNLSTDGRQPKKSRLQPISHQQNTPLLKKHHLFVLPHSAVKMDKWMKLFSFATPSSSPTTKKPAIMNQHQSNNTKDHGLNNISSSKEGMTTSNLGRGYYYKVSEVYTRRTTTSTITHTNSSIQSKLGQFANKQACIDDMDGNSDRTHTDDSKENKAKSTYSKSASHLNKKDDTETEDGNDDDYGDDGTIDTSPASSSFATLPATYIQTAKTWRYTKSNHVYATKTVNELDLILTEYVIWAEKMAIARNFMDERKMGSNDNNELVDADLEPLNIGAPELVLDWPKNWSYSQF